MGLAGSPFGPQTKSAVAISSGSGILRQGMGLAMQSANSRSSVRAARLTSRSSRSLRSLGRPALRACSGMAAPLLPDQSLHAGRRLTGR